MSKTPLSTLLNEQIKKPSPIRQIMKFADPANIRAMGLDPDDVISFGGGWVNHEAPEDFRNAYREIIDDDKAFHASGAYSATLGDLSCREAICRMEQEIFNMGDIGPDNIIVGMGSTQITHDMFVSVCNPGDTLMFLDPSYANYPGQVDFTVPGAKLVHLKVMDEESWQFTPDVSKTEEEFKELFHTHKPKLVMVPTPDNPTSQMIDEGLLKAMLEITAEAGSYLVLDMAYKAQYFGDSFPSYYSWSPEDHENLIALHSNSKWARGLGRRFGWMEANPEVIGAMERVQQVSILCPDSLHQMAMTKYLNGALDDGSLKRYVEVVRRQYEDTAKVTLDAIDKHLGLRRLTPQGGLYVVIDMKCDADVLVPKLLKGTGVLFIPGGGFGPSIKNGVRVSYGPHIHTHEKIVEGMERVGKYLNK